MAYDIDSAIFSKQRERYGSTPFKKDLTPEDEAQIEADYDATTPLMDADKLDAADAAAAGDAPVAPGPAKEDYDLDTILLMVQEYLQAAADEWANSYGGTGTYGVGTVTDDEEQALLDKLFPNGMDGAIDQDAWKRTFSNEPVPLAAATDLGVLGSKDDKVTESAQKSEPAPFDIDHRMQQWAAER